MPVKVREAATRDGFPPNAISVPFRVSDMVVPDGTASVVHDIVQNLRAPLDYIVYELAWLDSGEIQELTQFPIFWKPKAFREREATYLAGVNTAHRLVIEQLQPYKGGRWLSTLAGLANPDKHKTLIHVGHAATMHGVSIRQTPAATGVTEVQMQLNATAQIALEGGRPVVDALEEIETAIRSVVDEFDPCFRGECRHSATPPPSVGSIRHAEQKRNRKSG